MSAVTRRLPAPSRVIAVAATLVLLGAYVRVLYGIVDVSGDPTVFWVTVGMALVVATLLAGVLRVTLAIAIAAVALAAGLVWYVTSLPWAPEPVGMLYSNLELLSGKSVLRIERAGVWALSVTPGPIFVTWYLALRRWYASAVAVAALFLGYLVLTGDATTIVTLVGVVGGAAAVGFGDLEHRDGSGAAAEYVAMVLAAMVLVPAVVSVVPAGAGSPLSLTGGDGGGGTMEASLVGVDGQLDIKGAIELSPTVRATVRAERQQYWRVAGYNRFTGDGWLQSGTPVPYDSGALARPPGDTTPLVQRVAVESRLGVMPTAWRPLAVDGDGVANATVGPEGGLRPGPDLEAGDSYRVRSAVPRVSPDALAAAGRSYPEAIADRYLQLPASTPDRVESRTDRLTANAESPTETARVIEHWLQNNRGYSLDVTAPEGNVADAFLFDMDSGYCVYFATTMTTMLRTQGIPARFVVGYTTGQSVGDDTYVVRGYNAHAWVEVYVPDVGWVRYDPTPSGPRVAAEQARLEAARANGTTGVDTELSRPTPTPTPNGSATTTVTTTTSPGATTTVSGPNGTGSTTAPVGGSGSSLPRLPSAEQVALGLVVVVGAAAGLRRTGLAGRAVRAVWLRAQRRREPAADVEGAYRRAAYLLERRHRPRRPGETPRQYLEAVDAGEEVRRIYRVRERARYGPGVSADEADEVVRLVRALVAGD